MPQLIRTPEQIFREEGKDVYQIQFKDEQSRSPARDEILAWLKSNLPDTRVEPLAPSEYSGVICGYFGTLRIDFSEESLAVFCERWETPEGKSVDPRFQCYVYPYEVWREIVAEYPASFNRPSAPARAVWWDTPQGLVYHQTSPEQRPCSHQDLWFNAVQANPALKALDTEKLDYGRIFTDRNGGWVLCLESFLHKLSAQRKTEILEWFNLPDDTTVIEE